MFHFDPIDMLSPSSKPSRIGFAARASAATSLTVSAGGESSFCGSKKVMGGRKQKRHFPGSRRKAVNTGHPQVSNGPKKSGKSEAEIEGPFPGDVEAQSRRLALRREKSAPILATIRHWAQVTVGLPRSSLGKAVRYMLKRWEALSRFMEDPRIPLDNNAAERALRGPVVGRKVHYGSKSRRGTEVAAVFYTLLETAKLEGVNPSAYLKAATEQMLSAGEVLLPSDFDQAV